MKRRRKQAANSFSVEQVDGIVELLRRVNRLHPNLMSIPGTRDVQDKFLRMQSKLRGES